MDTNQKLNIWLIQTSEPILLDSSVKKMRSGFLVDKLIKKGHNILWWASAFDHFKKDWVFIEDKDVELEKNLKIKVLKGIGYRKNISISRFIDYRIIARKFRKIAPTMPKPDIILANMPHDIVYEAVMFAKKNNIPVIIDIRDYWPDVFLNVVPAKLRLFAKILLFKDFQMIKKSMRMANGLIAVTNAFLEWGLKYANREKTWRDRVFPHSYKKNKVQEDTEYIERFKDLFSSLKEKFIVLFVGTISKTYHNPFILLKAAEKLKANKNIHFIIAGDGELFKELNIASKKFTNITLTGWLNQDEIEFWLQKAKVGVAPVAEYIDFPTNKVYTYISAGLPVISAFQGDLKEIIQKYEIGFYYPPNDIDAFVDYIQKLYDDPTLYKKMSENAQRVFYKMFDADKIYEEYAEHIETIAENYCG